MEEKIAKIISYTFHPLLMPTYGTLLVFYINLDSFITIPAIAKLFMLCMIFISTFLIPAVGSHLLVKKGYIKSLLLDEKEERRIPLILTAVFYLLNYYFMNKLPLIASLKFFLLGTCVSIVAVMVISFFWKISTHMVGIGGIVGAVTGLSFRLSLNLSALIVILVCISGAVGFARLKLNTHSPAQVYTGFFLGMFAELCLFLFLR